MGNNLTPEQLKELTKAINKSLPPMFDDDFNIFFDSSPEDWEEPQDYYEIEDEMVVYSDNHNATVFETLIHTREGQARFNATQEVFQRHFTTVSFDFAPDLIITHTNEDCLELVVEIEADAKRFQLRLVFQGDGGYAPDGSGEHFPSSKLNFLLAYIDTFHDTLYADGWSGNGEYYDDNGQLTEKPPYYQKLEPIFPEICQIFKGYTLHPEMAMSRHQRQGE